ncbi:MAG: hypothetical protein HFH25_13225 [Lachnospiraceae bacterium]|nr:hypothetical protein [Lachnospiraceae bacterium]
MEVRSKNGLGKHLFNWRPENNQVEIVIKGMFYRVQLNRDKTGYSYRILEEIPKNQISAMK